MADTIMEKSSGLNWINIFFMVVCCFLISPFGMAVNQEGSTFKALSQSPDHQKISADGAILRRINTTTYLVQDGTGVLRVSIPLQLLPKNGLFPKNHISFEGEVEVEKDNTIEVTVENLTFSF